MLKLITSLFLTSLVGTLFGLIFIENFWKVFTIVIIFQFVAFYMFNQIYRNFLVSNIEASKINQIKEINRNITTVTCPCNDQHQQLVDIRFDSQVNYTCSKCNKEIKCEPFVNTYLLTEPIYFEPENEKTK